MAGIVTDTGKLKKALSCLDSAMKINPSNIFVLMNKASLEIDSSKYLCPSLTSGIRSPRFQALLYLLHDLDDW